MMRSLQGTDTRNSRAGYRFFFILFSFMKVRTTAIIMTRKAMLLADSCDAPSKVHINVVREFAK
jgi:Co/Zn/Cd efflux system component